MRYHELFERIDILKTIDNYGNKLIDRIKSDHSSNNRSIEQIIQSFIDADPTPNQKYTLWMIRTYLNKGINYLEDLSRTNYALSLFDKNKNKLPVKDINQIKSLNQLEDLVNEFDSNNTEQTNKDEIKEIKTKETEYWYRGPEGIILVPLTERSSCFWGKNTKWCTASIKSRNMFDHYNKKGKLFIIIDKKDNKKYQFQFETDQFMNEQDQEINIKPYLKKNQWIVKAIMPYLTSNAEVAYRYARYILKGPFPEGEPIISTDAKYSYEYAYDCLNNKFPLGEKAIATDKNYSYMYAKNVLKGPFPEGEKIIATSPRHAYEYATNILREPFPLGEPAIATEAYFSYWYATSIIKGPFPLGEKSISTDVIYAYEYAENLLKGPFPLGEPIISTDAQYSYWYSKSILKDRFPLGEKSMKQYPEIWGKYIKFLKEIGKDNKVS